MLFSLAITQINTFTDSLIAWGLAAAPGGPRLIPWLGGAIRYPLRQGAAAAIYYGERLYQVPLGIVGLAVAAAIFPLLSRHAAHGRRRRLGTDLTLGLRLVLCLSVPAGVGLIVLAQPLARLIFEHGNFSPEDSLRAGRMVAAYAWGVWAYCASTVMVRGFYALGDAATPVRIGAAVVALNLALNLVLIWPLEEAGLGVSTSLSAAVEVLALAAVFSRRRAPLRWRALALTAARTAAAAAAMAVVAVAALHAIPPSAGLVNAALRVALPVVLRRGGLPRRLLALSAAGNCRCCSPAARRAALALPAVRDYPKYDISPQRTQRSTEDETFDSRPLRFSASSAVSSDIDSWAIQGCLLAPGSAIAR